MNGSLVSDELQQILNDLVTEEYAPLRACRNALYDVIRSVKEQEQERERAAVKTIQDRYEKYGERYSWKKERWEPAEEPAVPEVALAPVPKPDDSLQEEVDVLQGLLGDLRRENLQLQNELATKTKGRP